MAKLKYLVIHCTATPEGRDVSAADIRRMHCSPVSVGGRGWKKPGYTDLFRLDGTVERIVDNNEDNNVDPWEITNGAKGYNSVSRHIVYAGGCPPKSVPDWQRKAKDTRTPAQKRAMEEYVKKFHAKHPTVKIVGHRDLPGVNKACPSFDVASWLKSIGINQ